MRRHGENCMRAGSMARAATQPMRRRGSDRHLRARSWDLQRGLHPSLRVRHQDYGNDCERRAAKVRKAHDGACS